MRVGDQRHTLTALPPGRDGTRCTGGWVGPRAGLDECGTLASTGVRTPNRQNRS